MFLGLGPITNLAIACVVRWEGVQQDREEIGETYEARQKYPFLNFNMNTREVQAHDEMKSHQARRRQFGHVFAPEVFRDASVPSGRREDRCKTVGACFRSLSSFVLRVLICFTFVLVVVRSRVWLASAG